MCIRFIPRMAQQLSNNGLLLGLGTKKISFNCFTEYCTGYPEVAKKTRMKEISFAFPFHSFNTYPFLSLFLGMLFSFLQRYYLRFPKVSFELITWTSTTGIGNIDTSRSST